jgi:GAF domain-containing protein
MAESLLYDANAPRELRYQALTSQLKALFDGEHDEIANAANMAAVIATAFRFHWVGFYFVKGNELVLGPFQGPVACTRIGRGKGVCGTAWECANTVVVPDVDSFPGHIACSALSKSEIVIPLKNMKGDVVGVLDIDSSQLNDFSEYDQHYLESWVKLYEEACYA